MNSNRSGVFLAIATFLIWGLSPIYFNALEGVQPVEIVAHRVVWSVILIIVILLGIRRAAVIIEVLKNRRTMLVLVATGFAVGFNWFIYIWSVTHGYILQASLGYYINPLVSVVLGVWFLSEKHGRWQWAAVGLACIGVMNMIISTGTVPWISLALAISFGIYGLLRKVLPVGALEGLLVETLFYLPFALIYLGWLQNTGVGYFGSSLNMTVLLIFSGIITTVPLVMFTAAAKRLRLGTLGFLQFIAPTCQFALAVFVYGEEFSQDHLITFGFIWAALGLYSFGTFTQSHAAEPLNDR